MRFKLIALALTLALSALPLAGCTKASTPPSVGGVTGPLVWGSADNVMKISRLYVSGQPDAAGLRAAKESGVTTVVNLRSPAEMNFDEAAAAQEAGLNYYQVPVSSRGDSFDSEAFARIKELVQAHPGEPMLLHCASGNRVTGWLAVHLVEDHGMSLDAALPIAQSAGPMRRDVEKRVRRYLDEAHER